MAAAEGLCHVRGQKMCQFEDARRLGDEADIGGSIKCYGGGSSKGCSVGAKQLATGTPPISTFVDLQSVWSEERAA